MERRASVVGIRIYFKVHGNKTTGTNVTCHLYPDYAIKAFSVQVILINLVPVVDLFRATDKTMLIRDFIILI